MSYDPVQPQQQYGQQPYGHTGYGSPPQHQPQQYQYQPQHQQQQQQYQVNNANPYYGDEPQQHQQQQYGHGSAHEPLIATGTPLYADCPNPAIQSKFVVAGYKDVPFAIAFAAQLVVSVIWAIVNSHTNSEQFHTSDNGNVNHSMVRKLRDYVPLAILLATAAVATALSMMRTFPKAYIIAANIVLILLNLAMAIFLTFIAKVIWAGIVMFFFTAIWALWLYLVRRRIPFAACLLSNSVKLVTRHYGTIVVSFVSILVLAVYLVVFIFMSVPTSNAINNSGKSDDGNKPHKQKHQHQEHASFLTYLAALFILLLFYWTTQVITNVVHVTCSGTVATWYFAGEASMPRNPSVASLKRATTTSFGSICFGSLLVALLKLMRDICRMFEGQTDSFIACIAACLISILEQLLEYFNVYAFTFCAIYGYGYIDAAKQTYEMIKKFFWSAIFNDNLVFPVLTMTSFIDSLAIGAILGYAADTAVVGVIAFLISYVIHILVLRVVYSSIVTIFVCIAESPETAQMTNPIFYAELMATAEQARPKPKQQQQQHQNV